MAENIDSGTPRRLASGVDGIDDILGGGLTPHRMYLIEGAPGAGKTTFALQFLLKGTEAGESGLYVTLSECSPMLPLESFALGVPCLVGPSSHLFRDDPWLAPRLVVEDPLNSALIARKLDRLIAEREAVIAHYRDYARSELAQAKRGIESLVA